jgi:protein N-terminal glutamine amidohydrolase
MRGVTAASPIRYQPFYCEENVWHLCHDERIVGTRRFAVFISNATRACLMHAQRAAPPGEPVMWDYHVVLLTGRDVWDLDCRLGAPLPVQTWLDATFPVLLPAPSAPRFRVVDAELFVERFASDRSHMRDAAGGWKQPPPPWPIIGDGSMNLNSFIDMERPFLGEVVDARGLVGLA